MTIEPTDAELDALWRFEASKNWDSTLAMRTSFTRAALAKWGTLRADKIVIPTDTMEQEFQQHYRRGYEAGKKASTPHPTQVHPIAQAAEPAAWLRNTTDPQPHAVTNLKYRSAADAMAGVEYIPVFAAPQPVAQEPLTDEWIRSRCKESWIFDTAKQWVRMTEAAHGIKGD